jgi:predicted  nucleic acid-binding Zn ribbon protein
MILNKVTFGPVPPRKRQEAEDAVESYISVLLHNGQAVGEYFHGMQNGELCAHVNLAGMGALSGKYQSAYAADRLATIMEVFGQLPRWTVLDDEVPKRDTTWTRAPFLYLFTNSFDWESPLCRGDTGKPIPIYRLPGSHEDRQAIYSWQQTYRDYDSIWIGCGHLEIPVYRELAMPDSELSRNGREICQYVESVTGVPTYYYLMRYWGRKNGEENRLCPGCGGVWRTEGPVALKSNFCAYGFQCAKCRLVSSMAVATDDLRHARIGEWSSSRPQPLALG